MQWSEDASNGSTLYERIRQFKTHAVFKHFGVSITEFLEMPSDIVSFILEQSSKAQREEGGIAGKLLADLERH